MTEATTIGLDIAKNVLHAHGADAAGQVVFSRRLTRAKLLDFFAAQPACLVAMEAVAARITGLGSSHSLGIAYASFRQPSSNPS